MKNAFLNLIMRYKRNLAYIGASVSQRRLLLRRLSMILVVHTENNTSFPNASTSYTHLYLKSDSQYVNIDVSMRQFSKDV